MKFTFTKRWFVFAFVFMLITDLFSMTEQLPLVILTCFIFVGIGFLGDCIIDAVSEDKDE